MWRFLLCNFTRAWAIAESSFLAQDRSLLTSVLWDASAPGPTEVKLFPIVEKLATNGPEVETKIRQLEESQYYTDIQKKIKK